MLFSINDNSLAYDENFDEFPNRCKHSFHPSVCICGERDGLIIANTSRHRNFLPILACSNCGSLRSTPYFSADTAKHYYGEVYGAVKRHATTPEELQHRQLETSIKLVLGSYYEHASSILDFGGGAGGRTLEGVKDGKKVALIEVEGEFSETAYAAGIKPHVNGDRYDLVVISHVIEHLLDPKAEIGSIIKDYCKTDGLLYIATPIIEETKTRKWLGLFHIAHKYYFTRKSLEGLLFELGARPEANIGRDGVVFKITGVPMPDQAIAAYKQSRKLVLQKLNYENGIWSRVSPKRLFSRSVQKRNNIKKNLQRFF